jgi:hypothetical protein
MPRRAQLALALVLLLVLAPLAGATCGIQCLAPAPRATSPAITRHACKNVVACCHSGAHAICGATQASDSNAALLSAETNAPAVPALATGAGEPATAISRSLATQKIDSSPPGELATASPIPIRV